MAQVNHESIMRLLVSFLALSFTHALAEQPPVVHMLVPGFTVQELPVHLSNINNLRFAPDGRLFALGYDGRSHVLKSSRLSQLIFQPKVMLHLAKTVS
jgi:hypothetical protein